MCAFYEYLSVFTSVERGVARLQDQEAPELDELGGPEATWVGGGPRVNGTRGAGFSLSCSQSSTQLGEGAGAGPGPGVNGWAGAGVNGTWRGQGLDCW